MILALLLSAAGTAVLGNAVFPDGAVDYVLAATPFFLLMILVELLLIHAGALKNNPGGQFTFADTWSSVTAGNTQQVWHHLFKRWIPYTLFYRTIYDEYRLVSLRDDDWIAFCAIFVVCDFVYYWYHRFGHSVAILWSGHNVHHSSEHFNFSTALRQSWTQAVMSGMWYLPAALIFPPKMFLVANQWVTIYQFWIHTCIVRRIGILEHVLNTPSHHRVHHDRRVHKNFGGVFIVWDRMFGTFHDELNHGPAEPNVKGDGGETCYFGIQDTISSYSEPAMQTLLHKSFLLGPMGMVAGPGLMTVTADRPLPKACPPSMLRLRIDQKEVPWPGKAYILGQLIICVVGMILCALFDKKTSTEDMTAASAFLVATMIASGLMIDGAISALVLEVLRLCVGITAGLARGLMPLVWVSVFSAVACLLFNRRLLGRSTVGKLHSKTE